MLCSRCSLVLPLMAALLVSGTMPVAAQDRDRTIGVTNTDDGTYDNAAPTQRPLPSANPVPNGRLSNAGNGQIGQRQTRRDTAANVPPLERIQGRVANRVQNRLRTRIDRFYDPQANAATPFRVASEQARTSRR
jgi:P pilus assembly chaperone PapD